MNSVRLLFFAVALLATSGAAQAQNAVTRSLFDPDLYTPLNGGVALVMNSGDTLAIDTSALTIMRNGVSLGTGVVGNTAGPSPQPVALFTFTSLTIPAGVTVTIAGSRPLGLLARRNMTIGSSLDLSGTGGNPRIDSEGANPGPSGKLGGFGGGSSSSSSGTNGGGPGGGGAATGEYAGGGGGGHGATGSAGVIQPGSTGSGPAGGGGSAYASSGIPDLLGGSGGGGAGGDVISWQTDETGGSGGAGGGALVLVAQETLTISGGTLSVRGGYGGFGDGNDWDGGGGGGSGGSLVISAPQIVIAGGWLYADGGTGGSTSYYAGNSGYPYYYPYYASGADGGDGAGGRVAIYTSNSISTSRVYAGTGTLYQNALNEPSFTYPPTLAIASSPVPGELDPTFSSDGIQTTTFTTQSQARSVVVQPDGKIVAIGFADNGSSNYDFAVARYHADGSLDTSFGTGGKTTTAIGAAHDQAYAVALQSDGKIVVGGFTDSGANGDFALVRYNSDGSLDNGLAGDLTPGDSFGTGGKVTTPFNLGSDNKDDIRAIAIQADGKIVAVGYAATASNRDVALARYNANGSLDTSFDGDGKLTFAVGSFNDYGFAVTLQPDGKILVGGSTYVSGTNTASVFVARLLPANGAFDLTFGSNGKVTTAILAHADGNSLTVQPDGKILLGGLADNTGNSGSGATADFVLLRYTSSGILDPTFTGDGVQTYDFGTAANSISAVRVQADGKIVAVGPTRQGSYDAMGILRVNADGSADTSFDGDGKVILDPGPQDDALYALDFDSSGNIVAAGLSENSSGVAQFAVVRLLGLPKPGVWNLTAVQGTSGSNLGITGQINPVNLSTTVSVEYGTTNALGGTQSIGTFTGNTLQNFSATLYPGGLIVGSTYHYRIVATNANGTTTTATQTFVYAPGGLDYTFASGGIQTNVGIGASQGRAVAMQSDGKIVVAGFTNNGTKNVPALVRYLSTGALDTTFGTGGVATMPLDGTNEQLYAVAIQSDGKIVAAGAAVRNGDWDMVLTRWTSTGQPDTSFDGDGVAFTGYGSNQDLWQAVSILPSGQILVAGYTQGSTTADYVLARYNSNGTLDATFDGDSGTSNGRVVASIGTMDGAYAMAVQPDGKIIVAGDSDSSIALIRFTSAGLIDTSFGTSGKVTAAVGVSTAVARSLALQPDGKIVAACTYFSAANDSNGLLMRFNANGTNDNTFDGDGRRGYGITTLNDAFQSVTIQADGRIVAVGRAGNSAAVWGDMVILRANADGSEDTTFDGDGILTLAPGPVNDHLYGVTLDASGNIVAAGLSDTSSGLALFSVVRVLALPETTLIKNPSFESVENFGGGIITGFNDWGWDVASSVTAENGITPYAGSRMLKFISSGPTMTPTSPWCDVPQYVDLSAYAPQISLGLVSATATARFNRVAGNASTDTRFNVIIEAHRGTVPGPFIAQNDVQLFSDANPSSWEPITNTYTLPTNTTHLLVGVYAYENIVDNSSGTEFDGHYADDVQLTINVAPFTATFASASSIGATVATPMLTGSSLGTITLGYAPTPGDSLMLIKNTGLPFITGQFSNLAQGQTVTLSYGGVSYNFVANYYGGTGNDLVLQWRGMAARTWGRQSFYPQEHVPPFTKIAAGGYHTVALKSDGTVVAWGRNDLGQTTVPVGLSGVAAIAAGYSHTLALKSDGTVVAWGRNDLGQTTVPVGLSGVVAIAAGGNQTVALKSDGTVMAWGFTGYGQTMVPADLSGVVSIAAGGSHMVALKSDGTVVAWGFNGYGQTTVPVGLSGVVSIAAGYSHTVALKSDGTVVPWGYNAYGQTTVPVGLSGVVAIAAGEDHTVALKSDGTVVAWGAIILGQISVPAGLSGVVSIAAGGSHTVALKSDGTVVAWGNNFDGQTTVPVGLSGMVSIAAGGSHTVALKSDGTVVDWGANFVDQTTVPVGLSGVVSIAAGYYHTVALKSDGTVVAWGYNGYGQTTVPAGLSGVVSIAAGGNHSVVLKRDGTVVAWGDNGQGQTTVPAGLSGVVSIAAGYSHTVALKNDGTVVAWGENYSGQTTVPAGLSDVVSIAAGEEHTVALKSNGTVVAWGSNGAGRTTVPAGLSGVVSIAAGYSHTVALKNDGTVVAWGHNGSGQTTVPADLSGASAIAAGYYHNVALIPLKPWAQPGMVSSITTTGATVQGETNPNGQPTTFTVQYGPTTSYGGTATFALPVADSLDWQTASLNLTGLASGTTYHYRLVSQSSVGTTTGQDQTFTTLPSTNANLSALTLSSGTLSPSFDSGIISYSATVANSVTILTLTPSLADATASFTVNGAANAPVSLNIGSNSIPIVVTAQDGTTTRTYWINVTRQTAAETWRTAWFGTPSSTGSTADEADYDNDGIANLVEWACDLNPTTASVLNAVAARHGPVFEYTYTRSVAAVNAGVTFTVEWSDTLLGGSWSSADVTEQILSDNGTVQQVKASVPVGSSGRRFVHLSVSAPP